MRRTAPTPACTAKPVRCCVGSTTPNRPWPPPTSPEKGWPSSTPSHPTPHSSSTKTCSASSGSPSASWTGCLPRPGCRATSTTARNWLTEAGTLYVIDFEWAQLEASVDDLTRLRYGLWNYHPHLQEAFLDGYGRTLTPDDHQVLRACGALRAVWLVVRGHHYGETDLVDANRQTLRRLMDEANDN